MRKITAGRRQVVFLGNTGPNNAREWAVVQYRNGPNGDGEKVMRVSTRLGVEPAVDFPVQWTDKKYLYQYLKNMRHKLSRPGVILMNKLATASRRVVAVDRAMVDEVQFGPMGGTSAFVVKAVAGGQGFEGDLKYGDLETRMKQALTGWEVTLKTKKVARPNIVGGGGTYEWFALDGKQGGQFVFFYGLALNRHILTLGAETPKGAMTLRTTNDAMNAMKTGWKATSASTKVQAGTWQEKAKAELEAELGGLETDYGPNKGRDYFSLESMSGRADNGESEWIVFKDMKSAERYAIEYVKEMLDDDPSMFDQKWLKNHVFVSPTDIRLISNEDADNYVEDIRYESEERLLDEAGMLRQWQSLEDKKDALSEKIDAEMDPRKSAMLMKQHTKLEDSQSALVDKADNKLRLELGKRTADQLKKDPLAFAEELGYSFDRDRPKWIQIDTMKAAKDAIKVDGVAHFLDGYDGEEVELDSGAVAFGTN